MDPMSRWIAEQTTSGEGSFVGFKTLNPKDSQEERLRQALYPVYFK
jgi:hypothetical protein